MNSACKIHLGALPRVLPSLKGVPLSEKLLPCSSMDDLRARLIEACYRLSASMVYNPHGFHYWPRDLKGCPVREETNQCARCTNGALIIARTFRGFVAGYEIAPEEPRGLVAADVFGHDFAVVGDFIVDWWGWEYEQSLQIPVIKREEGVRLGKYKPMDAWEVFPGNDFRPAGT